jgi:uncharacterized protein YjiS (DUF1127 family)
MAFIESLAGSRIKRSRPVLKTLVTRLALWRSRRDLAQLDSRALEDIGVTPEAAQREARLGIWDVPQTWHDR